MATGNDSVCVETNDTASTDSMCVDTNHTSTTQMATENDSGVCVDTDDTASTQMATENDSVCVDTNYTASTDSMCVANQNDNLKGFDSPVVCKSSLRALLDSCSPINRAVPPRTNNATRTNTISKKEVPIAYKPMFTQLNQIFNIQSIEMNPHVHCYVSNIPKDDFIFYRMKDCPWKLSAFRAALNNRLNLDFIMYDISSKTHANKPKLLVVSIVEPIDLNGVSWDLVSINAPLGKSVQITENNKVFLYTIISFMQCIIKYKIHFDIPTYPNDLNYTFSDRSDVENLLRELDHEKEVSTTNLKILI